jgi:signal peptidase I
MNPFLLSGDLLEVVPLDRELMHGDVIYFQSPSDGRMVVHRVVRLTASGAVTRGDNNLSDDPMPVPLEAIVGRAVAAHRGQRRFRIPGGEQGMARAILAKARHRTLSVLSGLFGSAYHGLSRTGLGNQLLPASLRPRIVAFGPALRQQLKLLLGQREIGHYDIRDGRWKIKMPFRLIVNESELGLAAAQADGASSQARVRARRRRHDRAGDG